MGKREGEAFLYVFLLKEERIRVGSKSIRVFWSIRAIRVLEHKSTRRISQRKIPPEKKRGKRISSGRKERKDASPRKEKKREEIYKEEKKTKDPPS